MADLSNVLAALATAAAEAEGHGSCGWFTVRPDGLVACSCGTYVYEVGVPVPSPVTGTAAAS